MKKYLNEFELEDERSRLSHSNDLKKLRRLYKKGLYEISDLNTPKLWDKLNNDEITYSSNPMSWDRVKTVISWMNKHSSILDVGFGSGVLEKMSLKLKKNNDICGIDISSVSVRRMRQRFPNFEFKKANIFNIPYKDNFFDYVAALEVLEHIPPSKTLVALKELKRVIKPGKHLIISVPLNEGLEEMIKNGINPNAHVRIYTQELIKAELRMAGFRIVKEKQLYAYNNHYLIKSVISNYITQKHTNNIILLCTK